MAPRILVADDYEDLVESLAEALRAEGFVVDTCARAADVARKLAAQHYSIVLTSVRPHGPHPAAALRDLVALAQPAPVGLMSGMPMDDELRATGAAFTLVKPFEYETLLLEIGRRARSGPATPEQASVVRAYFDALDRKDFQALAALCTEDVEYHLPGTDPEFARTVRGRDEFRRFSEDTFRRFADARFEVQELVGLPDSIVARYRSTWTSGGDPASLEGSIVLHLDARGRITRIGVRTDIPALKRDAPGSA